MYGYHNSLTESANECLCQTLQGRYSMKDQRAVKHCCGGRL